MKNNFLGFERNNGFGTRNHLLVLPTVVCSQSIAYMITKEALKYYNADDGKVKVLTNPYGCGQTGEDLQQTTRTLINAGLNPNVYGVVVVSLGCESVDYNYVTDKISEYKPTYLLRVQDHGMQKTVEKAVETLKKLSEDASKLKRKETDISNLNLGLECGGSDYTSGLAANPLVGRISDWVVSNGGTSIISEVPEFIGAEHIYARRAINDNVKEEIIKTVLGFERKLKEEAKVDFRTAQPSPGNIAGGLTTIEEKSLGAVKKSGSAPVSGVLKFAEIPKNKGHFLMNTPGFDVESVSGMVAGGSNIVLFTTGRGTPVGNPISPVIKITGNADTYKVMKDFIDFDASKIMEGTETIDEMAEKLKKLVLEVASGKLTKAEINDHNEFGIYRIGPTY